MSLAALYDEMTKVAAAEDEQELDKVAAVRELIEAMDDEELEQLFGKEAEDVTDEEVDGEFSDEEVKLAEDCIAAGRLMAQGFAEALSEE